MKARAPHRRTTALAVAACAAIFCGCTTLRSPFDPTGERLFAQPSLVPPPATGSYAPGSVAPGQLVPAPGTALPPIASAPPGVVTVPAAPLASPVGPGPTAPGMVFPEGLAPGAVAPGPAALGDLPPAAAPIGPMMPGAVALPPGGRELVLVPLESVAPIGSHVVLLAGTRDRDNYLRTGQRIDWTLSPGSVGQFVEVGGKGLSDWLTGDFTVPQILGPTQAITSTSRRYLRHSRGTPNPEDDITVLAGQAWITTTSLVEGPMWVNAHAPVGSAWQSRTAMVHWIDAQWCFPPPAITAAGVPHVFTTTVTRQSNQAPHVGWLVRYEITGGPPAGFSPDGQPVVEVAVDDQGRASAEIIQPQPLAGTNQISIQVIRPATADNPQRQLVVGAGSTLKTWADTDTPVTPAAPAMPPLGAAPQPSARPQIEVRTSGPEQAKVGDDVTFRIVVTNTGPIVASGLQVRDTFDEGLQHAEAPSPILKDLGTLAAGQSLAVGVVLRVTRPGRWCHHVEILSGEQVLAEGQACVLASGAAPPQVPPAAGPQVPAAASIALALSAPESAVMGEVVVFSIEVTNTGASPAASLQIAAEYDPILSPLRATEGHASLGAQIVWSIPAPPSNDLRLPRTEIAPRETVRYRIEFRPTAASPQACLRVAVKSGTQILAEQEKCVAIRAQAPAGPPPASLSVSVSANREPVTAGAELSYLIRVTNTGQTADSNVTLSVTLPAQLTLVRLRTVGPGGISYSVQGNTVRFQTVPQLGPGMRLDYRVRAQASQAGQAVVRAEVVSQSAAQPVAAEETTTVLPQ